MAFTETQKKILAIVQDNLPHSLEPYAEIAARCGCSEEEALELLRGLKARGIIRRFGASIRHQRTGWTKNAMTAWKAGEAEADIAGAVASAHPRISHAYYRPSSAPDWPYAFYAMIHGRTWEEVEGTARELAESWPLKEYAVLRSQRELKKTSMQYFSVI